MNNLESFLPDKAKKTIVEAIKEAEKNTSGEIRVHIENTTEKPTLERAKEVFLSLKMNQTQQKNGVLFYLDVTNKQFAILGDSGINKVVPPDFWEEAKQLVLEYLSKNQVEKALVSGILKVGEQLKQYFPYQKDDQNELPDDISIGN
jgi:uncharacterized membrane protein